MINRYIALSDLFQVKTMILYLKMAFHTFTEYYLTYAKHHGWMDN